VVIALAFGLALFEQSAGAAIAAAAGLVLGGLGLWGLRRSAALSAGQADHTELVQGFQARFGEPLTDLAQLKAVERDLHKAVTLAEEIEQRQTRLRAERAAVAAELARGLTALTGRQPDPQKWEAALNQLVARRRMLISEAHDLEKQLEGLGMDPSDYLERQPEVGYSKSELANLERQLDRLQVDLAAANAELQTLKQSLCSVTGDSIDRPWAELLGHVWELREQRAADYRRRTARILAQIGVHEVLERIGAAEDVRIRKGLQDPAVRRALSDTTQRYQAIDLRDDGLVVSSPTADYDLAELSTGAREQVLLALRMGFASRLAGGKPLFMLLDDAFQHSDWERRERLVEQVLRLVQSGWQVTYLTMDDHLRDVFDRAARQALGDGYRLHRIEA
jgi:uncharacterized protein YhaN